MHKIVILVILVLANLLIQIRCIIKGEYVRYFKNTADINPMDRIIRKDKNPGLFWFFVSKNVVVTVIIGFLFYKILTN